MDAICSRIPCHQNKSTPEVSSPTVGYISDDYSLKRRFKNHVDFSELRHPWCPPDTESQVEGRKQPFVVLTTLRWVLLDSLGPMNFERTTMSSISTYARVLQKLRSLRSCEFSVLRRKSPSLRHLGRRFLNNETFTMEEITLWEISQLPGINL